MKSIDKEEAFSHKSSPIDTENILDQNVAGKFFVLMQELNRFAEKNKIVIDNTLMNL